MRQHFAEPCPDYLRTGSHNLYPYHAYLRFSETPRRVWHADSDYDALAGIDTRRLGKKR